MCRHICAHTHAHTYTHTHSHTHTTHTLTQHIGSHSHTHSQTHTLILTLIHTLSHTTHILTITHCHPYSHTHTLTHSHPHTHIHSHTHTLSHIHIHTGCLPLPQAPLPSAPPACPPLLSFGGTGVSTGVPSQEKVRARGTQPLGPGGTPQPWLASLGWRQPSLRAPGAAGREHGRASLAQETQGHPRRSCNPLYLEGSAAQKGVKGWGTARCGFLSTLSRSL